MRWFIANEEGNCWDGQAFVPKNKATLYDFTTASFTAARLEAQVVEATATEFLSFIGRQGGNKRSLRKTMAVRRNGRKHTTHERSRIQD